MMDSLLDTKLQQLYKKINDILPTLIEYFSVGVDLEDDIIGVLGEVKKFLYDLIEEKYRGLLNRNENNIILKFNYIKKFKF